jgi:dTDP-4-amino-4,6-dideoxygalactose transaminase
MRPEDAREAVLRGGEGVKAIFPVHLAGQTVDMNGIAEVAQEFNLPVVDDACHAIGGILDGYSVGGCQYSDMTVFSFHPVKTVAMGEGGAVTTNNPNLARALRRALNHGIVREIGDFVGGDLTVAEDGTANPWAYEMHDLGFNYRASDIHCALGLSQLNKLESFVAIRRRLMKHYEELLVPLASIVRPTGRSKGCEPGWHLNVVLIDFVAAGISRKDLMTRLRARGIGTQVHYIPVHRQPYYRDRYGETDLPGSTQYYERCLSLPLSAGMSESDVERVITALKAELKL